MMERTILKVMNETEEQHIAALKERVHSLVVQNIELARKIKLMEEENADLRKELDGKE